MMVYLYVFFTDITRINMLTDTYFPIIFFIFAP